MWSPVIAEQLRQRGHDIQAVTERPELRGQPDKVIFAAAQSEQRTIVTENVIDFRPLAVQALHEGRSHAGVIFPSNRSFPRGDPRTIAHLVTALDRLLADDPALENLEYWLP